MAGQGKILFFTAKAALATTSAPYQGCLGKGASMAVVLIYIK